MGLYFTADIHGNAIKRFGYKIQPWMRELTKDDYIFVLGDCGIPWYNPELNFYDYWTKPGTEEAEIYQLEWLNSRPENYIFIRGNHDNTELIHEMPYTKLGNADVRQMFYINKTYNNIFYIDTPQFMYLQGKKILIIPGANSHDIDVLFDAYEEHIKEDIKKYEYYCRKHGEECFYRVKHFSWWEDEGVDEKKIQELLPKIPKEVDMVLTHAPCAAVHTLWKPAGTPARLAPLTSEVVLEDVRKQIKYDIWLHGHLHETVELPFLSSLGIYHQILDEEDINSIIKRWKIEEKYRKENLAAIQWYNS